MARNKNRTKKRNKNNYRKRGTLRHKHMRGVTILGDLSNNFTTLKNTFTNNMTTQAMTYAERAKQRFTKAKDAITKKINCIKSE